MTTESNSSVAQKHNFRHKRGDTFSRIIQYFLEDDVTPLVITGNTYEMEVVRPHKQSFLMFTFGAGLEITGVNEITLIKTATEMELEPGQYEYDIEQTMLDGTVTTLQEGLFIIESDIS